MAADVLCQDMQRKLSGERPTDSYFKACSELADEIIKGGFPGHAVLVADVAEQLGTGTRRFLLIQSFMPAQDMHVLRGAPGSDGSPWYGLEAGKPLVTPEWTFPPGSLRRWRFQR